MSESLSSRGDRRAYYLGGALLGYFDIAEDQYYIHPMYLEAEEKIGFEPGDSFGYLKESYSTHSGPMFAAYVAERRQSEQ